MSGTTVILGYIPDGVTLVPPNSPVTVVAGPNAAVDAAVAGAIAGMSGTFVAKSSNLSDVSSPATALRNIGGASAAARPLNLMDTGNALADAVADGSTHPLSTRFASLAAAQAVFPTATALTDEIDHQAVLKGLASSTRLNLGRGPRTYRLDKQLDLTATTQVAIEGDETTGSVTPVTRLLYVGGGSGSAVKVGSSAGFTLRGVNLNYSAGFTGRLLDAQKVSGGGDTRNVSLHDVWLGGTSGGLASMLLCLDGSHDVDLNRVTFTDAVAGLVGKLTQGQSSTGGYAIGVRLRGCAFPAGLTTAAIKNADQAWDIDATFEPLTSGAPGSYKHDAGVLADGVTFGPGCWHGDMSAAGSWITYSGKGLRLDGGYIAVSTSGKIVTFDEDGCVGFFVNGTVFDCNGGTGVDWGTTKGAGRVFMLPTWQGAGPDTAVNNPPVGAEYSTPARMVKTQQSIRHDTAETNRGQIVEQLTAAAVAVGADPVVNLFSADAASFEGGIGGWAANANANTPTSSTTQALDGTHSLKVVATANGASCSVISPFTSIAAVVSGRTYTAFASTFCETTQRQHRVDVHFYDSGGTDVGFFNGENQNGALAAWKQAGAISAFAPSTAVKARVVVNWLNVTAGDTFYLDRVQAAEGISVTWRAGGITPAPALTVDSTGATLRDDPTQAKHAATKGYVDSLTAGGVDFFSTFGFEPVYAGTANTSLTVTANQCLIVKVRPRRNFTLAKLVWIAGTAGGTGNYDIAVLAANGNLLWSKGSTAFPAANATSTETVTPLSMVAGTVYYTAFAMDNGTSTIRGASLVGFANAQDAQSANWSGVIASAFPIPSSNSVPNTNSTKVPMIQLREA